MTSDLLQIKIFDSIEGLDQGAWDRIGDADFPFADYAFLKSLEDGRCVGANTGWRPRYITAWHDDRLLGATFLYLKTNSYGEYIFDWEWAKAYHHHGLAYFPKLTGAIPFTPATGPKFLLDAAYEAEPLTEALLDAALALMAGLGCSSLHYLFLPRQNLVQLEAKRFLIRHSFQYHWRNDGYASFDDFLARLKPKRRKQILRERTQLQEAALSIAWISGEALTDEHAQMFYGFYRNTIEKMSAIPYLTLEFFRLVFERMRENVALVVASDRGEAIAGALYFKKGTALFGRYWGATREVRNLHFELCYYQPIAWAIEHGIKRFEAGAQGQHKIARGLLPELTYSAHWIRDPQFREAIAAFIGDERQEIDRYFDEMKPHHPFLS